MQWFCFDNKYNKINLLECILDKLTLTINDETVWQG